MRVTSVKVTAVPGGRVINYRTNVRTMAINLKTVRLTATEADPTCMKEMQVVAEALGVKRDKLNTE